MKYMRLIIDGTNAAHMLRHIPLSHYEKDDQREIVFGAQGGNRPTGTLTGFLITLLSRLKTFTPDEIVVVFDNGLSRTETLRGTRCPSYKQNREDKRAAATEDEKEELRKFYEMEMPDIHAMLAGFGIAQITAPNQYEADDVIACMCHAISGPRIENIVVSSDKDFLQLLRADRVRVYAPHTKRSFFVNSAGVIECDLPFSEKAGEMIGLTPAQYLFMRMLQGDASDNIHGVSGIGAIWARRIAIACTIQNHNDLNGWRRYVRTLVVQKEFGTAAQKILTQGDIVDRNIELMGLRGGKALCVQPDFVKTASRLYARIVNTEHPQLAGFFTNKRGVILRNTRVGDRCSMFFGQRGFQFAIHEEKLEGTVAPFRALARRTMRMREALSMKSKAEKLRDAAR